ncbi:50S ribosomal protein L21e [Candidatus Micrarchaeota archaeon]|nr:50S ribosomal protein L21e [Candidatus Micrarchaeota archaeon]
MVKRSRGMLSRRTKRLSGKHNATVSDFVRTFEVGAKVTISQRAYNIGLPALRYSNRYGTIIKKLGDSYVVEIQDGNKKKQLISHPIHLKLAS